MRSAKEAELRVHLEQEAKARAAEQERLLSHEKEMTAITAAERSKARNRKIAIGMAFGVVLASLGTYAFAIKPALERKALEAELARQEQQLALEEKTKAEEALAEERRRLEGIQSEKTRLEQRMKEREQRQREREARTKDRAKRPAAPKKRGCAPDDPLCGLEID